MPFVDVYYPYFSDFSIPVAVGWAISFDISDYREFIKLHRPSSFNLDDFKNITTVRLPKKISFERTNRIVDRHKITVRYIAGIAI